MQETQNQFTETKPPRSSGKDIGQTTSDRYILRIKNKLITHYRALVAERGYELQSIPDKELGKIARWLTGAGKNGIMLWGPYGTGKSTAMRAVKRMLNYDYGRPVDMYTAKKLCERGTDDLSWRASSCLLIIDELGREENERKDYGNITEPLIDLICKRENLGYPTMIATNLTDDELKEKYKLYVYDRLTDYCNKIFFNRPSYRKRDYGKAKD